ncbi:MAG TPA: RHS repeat-associated core domain-containing protein [Terriglobales bacterium]|nr:RHS repeat-associated core domain-containing protein [Terriglobales bacterium]
MNKHSIRIAWWAISLLILAAFPVWGKSAQAETDPASVEQSSSLLAGASSTLLPSGQLLLLGGQDARGKIQDRAALKDPATGMIAPLPVMHFARSYHSASVLPDGTVLILGGIGADGKIVTQAEQFDSETKTFSTVSSAPAARAFHTATLLTDGRLLIAGGISLGGKLTAALEIWDSRHPTTAPQSIELKTGRRNHTATLLADGRALLSGGKDEKGNLLAAGEVYDPQTQSTSVVENPSEMLAASAGMTEVRATSPEDQAVNVPVDALISMRFSRSVQMQSIKAETVLLEGPEGAVTAHVVPAERGMLTFITPLSPLQPGTTYNVTVSGAVDSSNAAVAHDQFTFTTAGVPPQDRADSDDERWKPTVDWKVHQSNKDPLPPLKAPDGVTALAGRVLRLNGKPLEHVTLTIGNKHVETDETGRFLLVDVPAGHQVLQIDATTANRPGKTYGYYEFGAELKAKKTNVLSFTIWMSLLDMAHAVNIPSPTTKEVVISNPTVPGLELRLPPGTVIYDRDHKVVHQVSITPIPLDRPPFPLPGGVDVPIYFTIQPGGAYIQVNGSSTIKGGRLFYPNLGHLTPGSIFVFWNYNADQGGWYQYGSGHVDPSGNQIVPDPGVVVYEFSGAMVGGRPGPAIGNQNDIKDGEPVNLSTGLFTYRKTDLSLPDVIPLSLTRTYRQLDGVNRSMGVGTSNPYEIFVAGDGHVFGITPYIILYLEDGTKVYFRQNALNPTTYVNFSSRTQWYGAVITLTGSTAIGPGGKTLPGELQIRTRNGTYYSFPDSSNISSVSCQALRGITDRFGNQVLINRTPRTGDNGVLFCDMLSVTSPNGRSITFQHDTDHHITSATDSAGRTVQYTYDVSGRLVGVTDVNGGLTQYTYDDSNNMTAIEDARGIPYLANSYDSNTNIVYQQTLADGTSTYRFLWNQTGNGQTVTFNDSGCGGCGGGADVLGFRNCLTCYDSYTPPIQDVEIFDPNGNERHIYYDSQTGNTKKQVFNENTPQQQTYTYAYYADNLLKSVTDPLGHVTNYNTYDGLGNPVSVTTMANTAAAATTQMVYDGNSDLLSVTDALNHTTTYGYDPQGDLTLIVDPLLHTTTMTYDSEGRMLSVTDPMQSESLQFLYDGPDLVTISDSESTLNRFCDAAGRVVSTTDPLGKVVQYSYNNFNQLTQVTDPLGGITSFTYDRNGNLLSVQDARQQGSSLQTSFTYDVMDRVATRTDPHGRQQSYGYDKNGNLTSFTDRKGKVTNIQYDWANRKTFAGFGATGNPPTYESTINYSYDAIGRLTQIVDSTSGTISHSYDDINRKATETVGARSVTTAMDAIGRLNTLSATGQPDVTYHYDPNSNHLLSIQKGAATVGFGYDNDNRRTSMTLSNGVLATYGYDAASRLTSINYQLNATSLGVLNYAYDAVGRRTQVNGSLARTGLPPALIAATYDANNEIASWNGQPFTYDNDGNLTYDGASTYSWNARNQLIGISGSVNASFAYDSLGRRTSKTIAAQNTGFTYNVGAIAQEVNGSTVIADIWNGGMNYFQRTDASGSFVPMTDALGSVLALVDASGTLGAQYTYDPYGSTSAFGTSGTSPFQYIGQENDILTSLYYLHARYYSPALGRFISQDPIGLAGGINVYAYASDDPIDFIDPFGLKACLDFWQKVFVVGHGLGNIGVGLGKIVVAGEVAMSTGPLTFPITMYLGIQGGFNVIGGIGELAAAYDGSARNALAAGNLGNMGTISGVVGAATYDWMYGDQGSAFDMFQEGSSLGQWENLASGFLINPLMGAEETASIVKGVYPAAGEGLTEAYDTGMNVLDNADTFEGEYEGAGRGCCK